MKVSFGNRSGDLPQMGRSEQLIAFINHLNVVVSKTGNSS